MIFDFFGTKGIKDNLESGLKNVTEAVERLSIQKEIDVLKTQNVAEAEIRATLAKKGYTQASIEAAMATTAEAGATQQLSASETTEQLTKLGLMKNAAQQLLLRSGLVTAKQLEDNATIKLTADEINQAVAEGRLSATGAALIAKALGLTGVNVTAAGSFQLLTASIWENIKAIATWLVTTPAGWLTLVIGGLLTFVTVMEALTVSVDEAHESLDKSVDAFEESTNKLKELENELQNVNEQISELQKLANAGTISVADQEQLELLKEANKELERKIALEQAEQIRTGKQVLRDAKKVSDAQVKSQYKYDIPYGEEQAQFITYQNVSVDEELGYALEAYEKYSKLLENEDLDDGTRAIYEKELQKAENRIVEMQAVVSDTVYAYDGLIDAGMELDVTQQNEYERLKKIQDAYLLFNYNLNKTKEAFRGLNTEQQKTILVTRLLEQGLTNEQANAVVNNISKSDYVKAWESNFDFIPPVFTDYKSATEYGIAYAKAWLKGVETATNNSGVSSSDLQKNVNSAYDSIKESYSVFDEFKEAMENGMTEAALDGVAGLSDELKALVAEYYAGVVTDDEIYSALEEHYDTDLKNYSDAIIAKNALNEEFYKRVGMLNSDYVNSFNTNYGVDISNCKTYAEAKLKIEQQTAQKSGALWIKYYDAQRGVVTAEYNKLKAQYEYLQDPKIAANAPNYYKDQVAEEWLAVQSMMDGYNNAINGLKDVMYQGIDVKFGIGGDEDALKEKFDWIETFISRLQSEIDKLGNAISRAFEPFDIRKSKLGDKIGLLEKELASQQTAKDEYREEAKNVGLKESIAKLVRDGKLKNGIKDNYTADEQKQIAEYQEWYDKYLGAEQRIEEITSDIVDEYQNKFDLISSEYDARLGAIEHEANAINNLIDQTEANGYMVSRSYYDSLIAVENKKQDELRAKRSDLQSALNEAMANGVTEYSETWYDLTGQIQEVDEAIQESTTSVIEFNNSIRDLEWVQFDKIQELVSEIHNEKDFFVELMSNEDLFDDNGNWTEYADATAGLHAMGYNAYMAQVKYYAEELSKVETDLAEKPYDEKLLERKQELLEAQRENILAAEDEKQAMIELAREGYDAMLKSLDELIEKRKEALDSERDLYEYQKKIADQTKNIASLEKQLMAYEGDDSEETQAKVQQLKVSLEEAKDELEQSEYDRWRQDQEQMLDKFASDTQDWVDQRLENQEELVRDILAAVDEDKDSIKNTLEGLAGEVGTSMSTSMTSIFGEKGSVFEKVNTTLTDIKELVSTMAKASLYDYTESDADRVKDIILKRSEPTDLDYEKYDLNGDGKITVNDFVMIKKKLKGYATGSRRITNDELAWTQENGQELIYRSKDGAMLTPLGTGDAVFTSEMTQRLWDIAKTPEIFSTLTSTALPKGFVSNGTNNSVQNDVVMNISLPNVVDVDGFVNELRTNKRFEKVVQSMTIGAISSKGNSYNKLKY